MNLSLRQTLFKIALMTLFCVSSSMLVFASDVIINKPHLLLAKKYNSSINIKNYWVSEKLDGVRGFWDGRHLLTKQGRLINAPQWFTKSLPNYSLDGELWIARQQFEQVSAIVRRKSAKNSEWKKIKYMIFDLPHSQKTFDIRLELLRHDIDSLQADHIRVVRQYKVSTHKELQEKLAEVTNNGGEGLMLHLGAAIYKSGRSSDLLKLKKFLDAEALVIGYIPGKGKNKNKLGSLMVEMLNENRSGQKKRFKLGSGFSDLERENPPPIGSVVTYKYTGFTKNGIPKFASYLRIRFTD